MPILHYSLFIINYSLFTANCEIRTYGASNQDRTGDLSLTMAALYLLSYRSMIYFDGQTQDLPLRQNLFYKFCIIHSSLFIINYSLCAYISAHIYSTISFIAFFLILCIALSIDLTGASNFVAILT